MSGAKDKTGTLFGQRPKATPNALEKVIEEADRESLIRLNVNSGSRCQADIESLDLSFYRCTRIFVFVSLHFEDHMGLFTRDTFLSHSLFLRFLKYWSSCGFFFSLAVFS